MAEIKSYTPHKKKGEISVRTYQDTSYAKRVAAETETEETV